MSDKIENFDEPEVEHEADKPMFSAEDIAKIRAEAKAEILKDRKAAAKKDMIAKEKHRLQREEGLTVGNSHMDQIVSINIDLAPYANRILINGESYFHGQRYSLPRHVAMSLQETMFRTWQHQAEIKGESYREFYAKKHVDDLYRVGSKSGASISARGM